MTKKQYRDDRAAWRKALVEGRVIVVSSSLFKSYPTKAMADAALVEFHASGHGSAYISQALQPKHTTACIDANDRSAVELCICR